MIYNRNNIGKMVSKNLKSYDSYEKEHINENFMSLAKTSNVPNFQSSDENLNDIIEDEETDLIENGAETVGLGTEEEKKINDMPIIAHIEVSNEIEIPIEDIIAIGNTEVVDTTINQVDTTNNGFNPSVSPSADMNSPKLFSIVKMMTQNGEKIGMCYTEEVGEYGTPIHNNVDFNSACDMIKSCCVEHGADEFSNDNDTIIGTIPSFFIPKKKTNTSTSYKPN